MFSPQVASFTHEGSPCAKCLVGAEGQRTLYGSPRMTVGLRPCASLLHRGPLYTVWLEFGDDEALYQSSCVSTVLEDGERSAAGVAAPRLVQSAKHDSLVSLHFVNTRAGLKEGVRWDVSHLYHAATLPVPS